MNDNEIKIPSGTVTFLFTETEDNTKLTQNYQDKHSENIEKQNSILRKTVESHNGFIFKTIGEALCCAFHNVSDAVSASVEAMINLDPDKNDKAKVFLKMGIHSGIAEWNGNDYMGYITLARTQRVMSAANGGQILISDNSHDLIKEKICLTNRFTTLPDCNDEITFRDMGERRLKDLIQPMKLFQVVSEKITAEFPSLKTLDARPNNLPIQLTSFIGRGEEMQQLKNLFRNTRLLTITGSGGAGKTRLAMQSGADMIDDFANGVFLVELAHITDPVYISQTIMNSLSVKEETDKTPDESLTLYLKNKELLLILDNCEHLIIHCAKLTELLLTSCPDLKIITTSREAMNCQGEQTFRLPSLSMPDVNIDNTPEQLTQYEAVRLFIERALAVNPAFRVNKDNAPALAQICSQLDGIPLAIELAAARIKVLTLEKICEKLDDRFRLLTGGKRTALPRQQTLKALIDWSYDLLNDNEKLLFQRLSVFSGGWTLEAAEEICSDDNFDSYEIMDTYSHLLDKSLINRTENSGSIRFYFLESIRQYAKELHPPEDNVYVKHFNYFLRITDQTQMMINTNGSDGTNGTNGTMDQKQWVKLIDTETGNCRAAVNHALKNDINAACVIVNNLINYWDVKAYFLEALQTCRKVLESDLSEISEINKAKIYYSAGLMFNNVGKIPDAEKFIKDSLIIFRKLNDKVGISECQNSLGVIINLNPARLKEAKEAYEEALSLVKELNLKRNTANVLYNLSYMAVAENDNELALKYRLESLDIYRELKDYSQTARTLASLSVFEQKRKNFEKALFYNEESMAIATELDDKFILSINLINLGNIYFGKEDYDNAIKMFNESLLILREYEYKSNLIAVLQLIGQTLEKKGEYEKAIAHHKESILLGRENGNEYFLATNIHGLGLAYFGMKDHESSLRYFTFLKTLTDGQYNPIGKVQLKLADENKSKLKENVSKEKYEAIVNEAMKLSKDEVVSYILGS
jgi:predicted ATPase/class 3 adenylate cyclase